MSTSKFQSELENYYETQRRSHLTAQLQTATKFMEETLLLSEVYNVLFEDGLSPDEDVRSQVASLRGNAQNKKLDALENELPGSIDALESERDDVRSKLQYELHEIEERIGGFEALNQRIEKIDPDRIESLKKTASGLDQVTIEEEIEFEQRVQEIRSEAQEFENDLSDVENSLFEDFRGSDIEDLVRSLLSGKELRLAERTVEDLTFLKDSELEPYVTLSLEGE